MNNKLRIKNLTKLVKAEVTHRNEARSDTYNKKSKKDEIRTETVPLCAGREMTTKLPAGDNSEASGSTRNAGFCEAEVEHNRLSQ